MVVAESRERPMVCTLVPHELCYHRFQLRMKYHRGVVGVIGGYILEMTVKGDW